MAAQGNQIVSQIIQRVMNSGLKQVIQNIFNSADPCKMATNIINAYVNKNPQYAPLWEQAQQMAGSGNAEQKAKNMFAERGVDIGGVVDGVMKEIKQ